MRARLARFGFLILDATTRTWGAFWGTLAVWTLYWLWNADAPTGDRFDPFPFIFLTLLITMASYLQNIVLMTDQRITNARLDRVREKQEAQDRHMLHLMETVAAAAAVLVQQAEAQRERDFAAAERQKLALKALGVSDGQ